jgi:hypothetical protein
LFLSKIIGEEGGAVFAPQKKRPIHIHSSFTPAEYLFQRVICFSINLFKIYKPPAMSVKNQRPPAEIAGC